MAPLNVHPPDPNHPKGMAFVMGAGFVDPRNGKTWADREPMALIQSWEPTSEMWWALGLRWHPELATKWLNGGGQFSVGELVDEKPEEMTIEQGAEEVLDYIAADNPEFAEMVKRIRAAGTDEEKAVLLKEFESNIRSIVKMAEYVKGGPSDDARSR
jgi:hypothetical protein